MQTLVDSERFLIDDRGDHIFECTFRSLRQDLRFGHVLDRATLEGQKQHVQTRFCPSNPLRTVKCRGEWELRVPLPSQRNLPSSWTGRYVNFASSLNTFPVWCAPQSNVTLYILPAVVTTRLLSSAFRLTHVHTPLYSRCTAVCISTHGHLRRYVLGSVCNVLTMYVYFASGHLPTRACPFVLLLHSRLYKYLWTHA